MEKKKIDLKGEEGNAFVLIAYADSLCEDHSIDFRKVKEEMLMSDYDNLIAVFEKYFSDWVELIK